MKQLSRHLRSKHHISIKRLDGSSISNYEDGYWDGADGASDKGGDGNNDYCEVSVC